MPYPGTALLGAPARFHLIAWQIAPAYSRRMGCGMDVFCTEPHRCQPLLKVKTDSRRLILNRAGMFNSQLPGRNFPCNHKYFHQSSC
jgi:hypothetical protein